MSAPMPRVIGLHGVARSGKDTTAGFLAEYGYERLAFADALRNGLYALNPIVGADNRGRLVRVQEVVDEVGWDDAKAYRLSDEGDPEIRVLLQRLGTEVGRDLISDTVWVDIVLNQIKKGGAGRRFVITDVRFPNELAALRNISAEMWKISRKGYGSVNAHASDAGIDDQYFDVLIHNDSDLETLHTKVTKALLMESVRT